MEIIMKLLIVCFFIIFVGSILYKFIVDGNIKLALFTIVSLIIVFLS